MNCCVECFCDSEIRSVIQHEEQIGNCDFCGNKNVAIYVIGSNSKENVIQDLLNNILDLYSITENEPNGKLLQEALSEDWDIFNCTPDAIQLLIQNICTSKFLSNPTLFNSTVSISEFTDTDFLQEYGVVNGLSWDNFSESIKYQNRFHSGLFNPDSFASFLSYAVKSYAPETEMFRARICTNGTSFMTSQMGAPPKEKRMAGRINPEGIGVLYLSSNFHTALNEVRAVAFDFVTVGKFKLTKAIKVVNLSGMAKISPFIYGNSLEQFAINRKVFKDMANEVAKPLRRNDSPLEYLPTQYIADFIKSQGYDGIEYASTMQTGGYNLAIFDETLFTCFEINAVEIKKLNYEIETLS